MQYKKTNLTNSWLLCCSEEERKLLLTFLSFYPENDLLHGDIQTSQTYFPWLWVRHNVLWAVKAIDTFAEIMDLGEVDGPNVY